MFLVAYLSFGVPAIVAGQLVAPLGLFTTVVLYGTAILAAASAGLLSQWRLTRAG